MTTMTTHFKWDLKLDNIFINNIFYMFYFFFCYIYKFSIKNKYKFKRDPMVVQILYYGGWMEWMYEWFDWLLLLYWRMNFLLCVCTCLYLYFAKILLVFRWWWWWNFKRKERNKVWTCFHASINFVQVQKLEEICNKRKTKL